MKRDMILFFSLILFLSVVPGCMRLVDWGKSMVDQGKNIKENVKDARSYIRSNRIYDQFSLVGGFDSLWLSDEVRGTYANLYALKHGKGEEAKNLFLRRQLEENNHFVAFYVLGVSDIEIGSGNSDWAIFLKIGDDYFVPIEFKKVKLSPEYELVFGEKFNRFKTAYIIKFGAKDIEDRPIIKPNTQTISLVFKTFKKEVVQEWVIGGARQQEQHDMEVVA